MDEGLGGGQTVLRVCFWRADRGLPCRPVVSSLRPRACDSTITEVMVQYRSFGQVGKAKQLLTPEAVSCPFPPSPSNNYPFQRIYQSLGGRVFFALIPAASQNQGVLDII